MSLNFGGNVKYNPLHKPDLKPIVLANRLKTILTLFSTNNTDSYWLDKVEQVLCECIKLCRIYNNGYVTFSEIHKLVCSRDYFCEKVAALRSDFQHNSLGTRTIFDLASSLDFFEKEFYCLDSRVLSILKSEITRITSLFISDLDVSNTFCSDVNTLSFNGFADAIQEGKIVVLNMNIAEYRNLSKIIAAYLKLDFQTEVISNISKHSVKPCAFICDEYSEYVTSTDAEFFSQSREAKCINIVSTQSYTSILNALKDENATKVIIQNLINKLWFRTDDNFTIEEAQKLLGKEDKYRVSKSISENAKSVSYNYLLNSFKSDDAAFSESYSLYAQHDFIYDTQFFTQELSTFSCLALLSDGNQVSNYGKVKLYPYFKTTMRR